MSLELKKKRFSHRYASITFYMPTPTEGGESIPFMMITSSNQESTASVALSKREVDELIQWLKENNVEQRT